MILTTFPDEKTADTVIDGLLANQLAACAQKMPIQSTYRWKGEIQHGREILVTIKTISSRYPEVESFIRDRHPYELPEIIQIPITNGLDGYLRWLSAESMG